MESYLNIRRLDVGVRQTFMPGELHLSLPDEAYYHPVIKELENLVVDLVILDNVSYLELFPLMSHVVLIPLIVIL